MSKIEKKLIACINELDEEAKEALFIVLSNRVGDEDSEPDNDEEDGEEEEEVQKPRRGKLRAKKDEDEEEDEDEDNSEDDEDEDKPVRKSATNKGNRTMAKGNKVSAKTSSKKDTKPAKSEKKSAANAPITFETANFSEMKPVALKAMATEAGLNIKKLGKMDLADGLTEIQTMALGKKSYSYFEKLGEKADVEIKQPRGRTTEEKKKRVAIIQLINAGHSPL